MLNFLFILSIKIQAFREKFTVATTPQSSEFDMFTVPQTFATWVLGPVLMYSIATAVSGKSRTKEDEIFRNVTTASTFVAAVASTNDVSPELTKIASTVAVVSASGHLFYKYMLKGETWVPFW